jgi:hypothetical protein
VSDTATGTRVASDSGASRKLASVVVASGACDDRQRCDVMARIYKVESMHNSMRTCMHCSCMLACAWQLACRLQCAVPQALERYFVEQSCQYCQ